MQDAIFEESIALPAAAGSVESTALDFNAKTALAYSAENYHIEIVAPVLTTTELPDAETTTYMLEESDDNSTFSELYGAGKLVQTGAASAGAAAATVKVALPPDHKQYVRVKATGSTTIGDQSGKSVTIRALFK